MKVKEMIKLLEANGWEMFRIRGDHRTFKKRGEALIVTVPGKLNDDMDTGTYKSCLKKAGLKNKEIWKKSE